MSQRGFYGRISAEGSVNPIAELLLIVTLRTSVRCPLNSTADERIKLATM